MRFKQWMNSIGYTDEDMSMMYSGDLLGMKDAWNAAIDEAVKVVESCDIHGSEEIYDKIKRLKE